MTASSISHHRTPVPRRRAAIVAVIGPTNSHAVVLGSIWPAGSESGQPTWSRHGSTTRICPVVSPHGPVTCQRSPEAGCSSVSSRPRLVEGGRFPWRPLLGQA
jgi:hypothetical protein